MWAKHRKISFYGSKNCGKFTASHRSNFPSAPAFHTSIIRPLKQVWKKNCGYPLWNGWWTHTALRSGNCWHQPFPKQKSRKSQNAVKRLARESKCLAFLKLLYLQREHCDAYQSQNYHFERQPQWSFQKPFLVFFLRGVFHSKPGVFMLILCNFRCNKWSVYAPSSECADTESAETLPRPHDHGWRPPASNRPRHGKWDSNAPDRHCTRTGGARQRFYDTDGQQRHLWINLNVLAVGVSSGVF